MSDFVDLDVRRRRLAGIIKGIETPFVTVVSLATPDGGKAGVRTEVTRQIAAELLLDGKAVLTAPDESIVIRGTQPITDQELREAEQASSDLWDQTAASAFEEYLTPQPPPPAYQILTDVQRWSINNVLTTCHEESIRNGWWHNADGSPRKPDVLQAIALMHSELSEALEGDRKDSMDTHLPHRKMIEVELADLVARVGDLAGALGLDIAGALNEKLAYNRQRVDHTPAARRVVNGKRY